MGKGKEIKEQVKVLGVCGLSLILYFENVTGNVYNQAYKVGAICGG